jgi:hypothetical protein
MRALLKNMRTGLYYKSAKSWTTESESALDFETIEKAKKFAFVAELEQVSVILSCDEPVYEVALPVGGGPVP